MFVKLDSEYQLGTFSISTKVQTQTVLARISPLLFFSKIRSDFRFVGGVTLISC